MVGVVKVGFARHSICSCMWREDRFGLRAELIAHLRLQESPTTPGRLRITAKRLYGDTKSFGSWWKE